jgi:class 3 adenylate cyclase
MRNLLACLFAPSVKLLLLASRMESSGEVGKVNISGATYELVKDKFVCTHRGAIQAKNKGEVEMYFVERFL